MNKFNFKVKNRIELLSNIIQNGENGILKKKFLTFSLFTVTQLVKVPDKLFSDMAFLDNDTVAVYGKTNDQRSVRIYNLARRCELHCIELVNACGGIAAVKVGGTAMLAIAF